MMSQKSASTSPVPERIPRSHDARVQKTRRKLRDIAEANEDKRDERIDNSRGRFHQTESYGMRKKSGRKAAGECGADAFHLTTTHLSYFLAFFNCAVLYPISLEKGLGLLWY